MAKKLTFKREDAKNTRMVVNGIAVVTHSYLVVPASITKQQLESHVATAAKHEDDEWTVPFGELGELVWPDKEGLLEKSANYLNDSGVSIEDWPVYAITE